MPVVLLHLLNTLPIFTASGLKVASGSVVESFTLDAVSAEFDRLIVTIIVLLHDHLEVSIVVQIVIVHNNSLLDGLLQWRVSQVINNTSMHWSMANTLKRLMLHY
jgi:hypothetical protein